MMKKNKLLFPLNLQLFAEEGKEGGEPNEGNNGNDEGNPNPPTSFSQEDLDKAVQDGIAKAKAKWQEDLLKRETEAEKLKKMNAKEKEEYQQKKREEDLLKREKDLEKRELMATAKETLSSKKLPTTLASCLDYSNAENCNKSIDAIGKAFQEAVQEAVSEKIKGGKTFKMSKNDKQDLTDEEIIYTTMMGN